MKLIPKLILVIGTLILFSDNIYSQSDFCASATEYNNTALCIPVAGTNQGSTANTATDDSYAPSDICAASLENTVWYSFTAPATDTYTITFDLGACASGFGLQTGVLSGECGGPYSSLNCSYVPSNTEISYSFTIDAGAEVFVVIDGDGGDSCPFDMDICGTTCNIITSFVAPSDVCIDAGTQAGLGGATPTGGVYSGAGVTDDSNGMTYSFNPAVAGVGTHIISYDVMDSDGCVGSASDDIEVFALPTVSLVIPSGLDEVCINNSTYIVSMAGSPTGGTYSGTGVTDSGNGTSFSFNPAVAGAGTHTVTYTFTDTNGCTNSANDDILVNPLPVVGFTALADLCINDGVQAGLGGGTPAGGVYSGTGVTDDGNGMTYSFDPAVAGVGTETLTYTFTDANGCTNSANDNVEVFALPSVTFTAPADLCVGAGVQAGLGGGTPVGGVYSGTGVTDDGNGMTYSFDPASAGVGTHTITYTVGVAGCTGSAMDDIEVYAEPTVTFTALADLCLDAGVQAGLGGGAPTGGIYSGPGVSDDGNGMTYTFDPAAAAIGVHTLTYSFTDANGCTGM
ncbi:MAG: hypothetical protein P1U56_26505, partial [Saprospiraceae bacterium]|nr:hypothetical protein [Saprospiraceae bacterium]